MAHNRAAMEVSRALLDGEDRFDLKRQLADTLQGRIYSATDRNTTDYCVVKETWKQLVRMKRSRDGHRVPEDFENEKAIMSYLSNDTHPHPGFVRILDEWEDEHCYFYAMEGCRGGELFQYIKDQHTKGSLQSWVTSQSRMAQRAMKENNEWTLMVKTMFRQLVDCVAWMHARGVCHLDLSLENSMIHDRRKKHVKIIDFGLGKYFGKDDLIAINKRYNKQKTQQSNNTTRSSIRPTYSTLDVSQLDFTNNQRVGKTGYMAPEVYAREKYDARAADIWSLGVMLFMMCIGAPPYEYPTEQNAAFRFIISGKLSDVLRHWRRLRLVTVEQLDLMEKIFKPEKERITMDEILAHPFVDLKRKPLFQPKQPKRKPNYAKNFRPSSKLGAPYSAMTEVQEEKVDKRNGKTKTTNTTVVTTRKNNDDDDDNNNNGGSSPGNSGGRGGSGGGNNSGGNSSGGNAGGGSNNGRDSSNNNNDNNNQNNGQQQQRGQQNSNYKSSAAQKYHTRIASTESSDVQELRSILKDVEKKRNELLQAQAKNNKRGVTVDVRSGGGGGAGAGGSDDPLSPKAEDDSQQQLDPKTLQIAIDELERIQNQVQQRIDGRS